MSDVGDKIASPGRRPSDAEPIPTVLAMESDQLPETAGASAAESAPHPVLELEPALEAEPEPEAEPGPEPEFGDGALSVPPFLTKLFDILCNDNLRNWVPSRYLPDGTSRDEAEGPKRLVFAGFRGWFGMQLGMPPRLSRAGFPE